MDAAAYAEVQRQVKTRLSENVAKLPRDSFNVRWTLAEALRCALADATGQELETIYSEINEVLRSEPATPFAGALAGALFKRPGPADKMLPILGALDLHPHCGVRAAALSLRFITAGDPTREEIGSLAQAALRSTCWRLQATAQARLKKTNIAPAANVPLPSFLRTGSGFNR